jgi:hypothetical protein
VEPTEEVLIPCITEKFIYVRVVEFYANTKTRKGLADIGNGTTYGEPSWGEFVVAIVRLGQEKTVEDQKEGTISLLEYQYLKEQLRKTEEISDQNSF